MGTIMPPFLPEDDFMPFGQDDMLGRPQLPQGIGPGQDPLAVGGPSDGMGDMMMRVQHQGMPSGFKMGPNGLEEIFEPTNDEDALASGSTPEFRKNLAEDLDEETLTKIGRDICERLEKDVEDRGPWAERFKKGLEMIGVKASAMDDGPFPGATQVVHPLISEAIVQFWARAMGELVPSEGPVKSKVLGRQSQQQNQRADRIQSYMNHELMFVDDGWYQEHSRTLFAVPYQGCAIKKIYHDETYGKNLSVYVPAEDFITPPGYSDMMSMPRFAHRIWRTTNQIRRDIVSGTYRDVELVPPEEEELSDEAEGRIESGDQTHSGEEETSRRYELLETYIDWDLPGYEDEAGIELPYIITVEKSSMKVLGIYRNWKETDSLRRKRVCFVKYGYVPGFSFYDFGLLHLIGSLQEAATGALRCLLDSGATASLNGGFVAKDANMKEQRLAIEPGVWKPVDATSDELAKAFFTPPTRDPSPALFNLVGFLTDRAEKFAATTELMTGETNAKAPVGSTIAVIEQAAKVFSTIHRGLHMSMAEELRLRYELIQEHMPVGGYPYDVDGQHEGLFEADFAPGVSITPVSDPNIFSSAQRVAIAQAVYQLAGENPDIIKRPVAVRRVLEAIKVPDIDELMIENEPPPPMDPISEIQALLRGEPVQAYPDQMHVAHLQHYAAFLQNQGFGAHPQVMEQLGPQVMALVGQRLAYAWATQAREAGAPAPLLPPPIAPPGAAPQGPPGAMQQLGGPGVPQQPQVPPEVITQMAAQIAPMMAQAQGMPLPPQPEDPKAKAMEAEIAMKGEEMQLKKAQTEQDLALRGAQMQQEMAMRERDAEMKAQELELKRYEMEAKSRIEDEKARRELERDEILNQREALKTQQEHDRHLQQMELEVQRLEIEREMAKIKAAMMVEDQKAKKEMAESKEKEKGESAKHEKDESAKTNAQNGDLIKSFASTMEGLASALTSPRRVIRDADGRAVGVEPVTSSSKRKK